MDSNPTIFIVTKLIGGYAREDAPGVSVVGCFTDEDVARKVALATSGKVAPVALNNLSAGLIASLEQLGLKLDTQALAALMALDAMSWLDEDPCDTPELAAAKKQARDALAGAQKPN
ncbi:MAG: hypothetical protein B7X51_01355 [Pseudomonas sp. 34-62-33]|nr:MAG: hypothetical protein B7X51_01355 [Pseudomonas sp. 34-62-33]